MDANQAGLNRSGARIVYVLSPGSTTQLWVSGKFQVYFQSVAPVRFQKSSASNLQNDPQNIKSNRLVCFDVSENVSML